MLYLHVRTLRTVYSFQIGVQNPSTQDYPCLNGVFGHKYAPGGLQFRMREINTAEMFISGGHDSHDT